MAKATLKSRVAALVEYAEEKGVEAGSLAVEFDVPRETFGAGADEETLIAYLLRGGKHTDDEVRKAIDKYEKQEKSVKTVPELAALKLITVYGDESTTLISLTHRVQIADFDGDEPQGNIPHVYLSQIEQAAGEAYHGAEFKGEEEGFPGWEAIYDYLDKHPDLWVNEDEDKK